MNKLVLKDNPQKVFDEAIARGFFVYAPDYTENHVYRWMYVGHDDAGNVWFRHMEDPKFMLMPPKSDTDHNTGEANSSAKIIPFPDGGAR